MKPLVVTMAATAVVLLVVVLALVKVGHAVDGFEHRLEHGGVSTR